MKQVDVAIIGAGSAGLGAFSQAVRATENIVVVHDGPHGTTCARVGCMPSKVLIQVAEDFHRRHTFASLGIHGAEALYVDSAQVMNHVRQLRDRFVRGVLGGTVKKIGDERLLTGRARFLDAHTLEVNGTPIRAAKIIIASGSRPIIPATWRSFTRAVLTSDEIFELPELPSSIAVMGVGVIGMELGQALSRLGVRTTAFGRSGRIAGLSDPVVNQVAVDTIGQELSLVFANDVTASETGDGRYQITWSGGSIIVDAILAAQGRTPNVDGLGLENTGMVLDSSGVPVFNRHTMQIEGAPHIFLAGDVQGELPILHEASDEGKIAGYNAVASSPQAFRRRTPLAITFCHPEVAVVGLPWKALESCGNAVAVGEVSFAGQGRALVMSRNHGHLRVYGDAASGTLLGAELCCPGGEHLAHLLAWAIQEGKTVFDVLRYPFYHPVVEEGLRTALRELGGKIDPAQVGLELKNDE